MAMARQAPTLKPREAKAFREFVTYAANKWARSQTELATITGLSQAMIASISGGKEPGGGRSLMAMSNATGITIQDILSGVGLQKLRDKGKSSAERKQHEQRARAAEALAVLFELPVGEVLELFSELGVTLPKEVSAVTWFDVGRAALERRRLGLALTRTLTT